MRMVSWAPRRRRRCVRAAVSPPLPLRPSSGLVFAGAHAHARARARDEVDLVITITPPPPLLMSLCHRCDVASCVWFSRRHVSLSSRRDHRRKFSSSYEVSWRERRVRKPPARPTARSTDRIPYRPPLHARVALSKIAISRVPEGRRRGNHEAYVGRRGHYLAATHAPGRRGASDAERLEEEELSVAARTLSVVEPARRVVAKYI